MASYMHSMRVYITSCQMQTEQHYVFCSTAQARESGIPLFVQQQQQQLLRHQLSAMADQFLLGQQHYIQVRCSHARARCGILEHCHAVNLS